jgi:hypothetical protein
VVQHDDGRARLMRRFWFQALSVLELTVIFSSSLQTLRT